MESLPKEIVSLICISNLKNCRLIAKQFNLYLDRIFRQNLLFYSSKINHNYDSIKNIIVSDMKDLPKFSNLKKIYFSDNFHGDIKEGIPTSVTHLTFGWNFNQDIKGIIPNSVTHLSFGFSFNKDIKGAIPESVIYLYIYQYYDELPKNIIIKNFIYLFI